MILAGSIWVFAETGRSWWLFALLLLVPDVSMVGYLRDARLGAAIYNLGHILLGPAVLLAWGVARARILLPFWISPFVSLFGSGWPDPWVTQFLPVHSRVGV